MAEPIDLRVQRFVYVLVRLPKAPGAAASTLASDLHQPRGVAHDQRWIYVTSDSPARIVRVPRTGP